MQWFATFAKGGQWFSWSDVEEIPFPPWFSLHPFPSEADHALSHMALAKAGLRF